MTRLTDATLHALLLHIDAGQNVQTAASAAGCSVSQAYSALRVERPDRTRTPRARSSKMRNKVLGLASAGIPVRRVAFLCQCKRQWVYRILSEAGMVPTRKRAEQKEGNGT